jgi:hypothetical protein
VADRDAAGGQVHVHPAQPQQLAPAQPERGQQEPGGIQPILTNRREKGPNLLGCPSVHLDPAGAGRSGLGGHVADHQAVGHGIPKRTAERGVDIADRLGRQRPAVLAAGGHQFPVEGADASRGEPLKRDVPEPGHDVSADVVTVAAERRSPNLAGHRRQPHLRQVGADREPTRLHIYAIPDAPEGFSLGRLSLPLRLEPANTPTTTLAIRASRDINEDIPPLVLRVAGDAHATASRRSRST